MLPFYLIATAIVIGGGVLSYRQATSKLPLEVRSQAHAKLPPRPATEASSASKPLPFKGEGAWVLAVLPACFEQTQLIDGPREFVHGRLPADAAPLASGNRFNAGNCILSDDGGTIVVTRGKDRFKLTSDVTVLRSGDGLVTYRQRGQLAELRMYRMLR